MVHIRFLVLYATVCSVLQISRQSSQFTFTPQNVSSVRTSQTTLPVANLRSSDVSSTSVAHREQSVYIIWARVISTRRSLCKMPVFVQF
jgi:hypothetical protein